MAARKKKQPDTAAPRTDPGIARVIVIDPDWQYQYENSKNGGVANHYKTSPLAEIVSSVDVPALADPRGSALCMWATFPCLPEALALFDAWGYDYKTQLFTWIKLTRDGRPITNGLGHYTRSNPEVCLLGTRGKPPKVKRHDVRSVITTVEDADADEAEDNYADLFAAEVLLARRREHSRKPDEAYERIERLWDGPYLEVFARQPWPGWWSYGDEAAKFAAQPFLLAAESRIA